MSSGWILLIVFLVIGVVIYMLASNSANTYVAALQGTREGYKMAGGFINKYMKNKNSKKRK